MWGRETENLFDKAVRDIIFHQVEYTMGFYPDFPDISIKAVIVPEACHIEKKKVR